MLTPEYLEGLSECDGAAWSYRDGLLECKTAWSHDRQRIEELERENAALRANTSKSVLRRLEEQGIKTLPRT